MADRFVNQQVADRNSVYDTTKINSNVVYNVRDESAGINELLGTLDGFMAKAAHQLDKETVRKAQLAGSMAGLNPKFTEAEGDSLAAETFNKAGVEIFVNRKLADVSTQIQKISIDPAYRNDPVRMQHVLEDQKAKFLADVPLTALPDFVVAYEDRMSRAIQGAQQNQVSMTISANAGQFAETEAALLAEITNAARAGDENAMNQARTEYFRAIDRQVGLSLMPEEASKRKITLQRQVQKDAVIGDFLRTPAEERPAFVESFIKDNPLQSILQASEVDDMKREMISAWNVDENLKDAAEEETKKTNEATVDVLKSDFHLAPTTDNYTKLVTSPGVTPEDIKSARTYLNQYMNEPDPVMADEVETLIYGGKYAEAQKLLNDPKTAPRLGQKKMTEVRTLIADAQAGGGFEATEGYKEVVRRINEDYTEESGLAAQGKMLRQQVYDKMRTEYPKYLRGELDYDAVDPVRAYNLKRGNAEKVANETAGQAIKTKQGDVIIPKIYLDDPAKYELDKNTMDKRLQQKEIKDYMIQLRVKKELEEKNKGTK